MWKHGTTWGYRNGCRCEECRTAVREASRDYRARRPKEIPEGLHGSASTYSNRGCRCDECRAAASAVHAEQVARRRGKPIPDHVHGTINGYTYYRCRCPACTYAAGPGRRRR